MIYKRTHSGDPDPSSGVFGNNDCMGSVRGWQYDAVIGIGGIGPEPRRKGIGGKLTWVGIGPHRVDNLSKPRNPKVSFDHFWYLGEGGPLIEVLYPALAKRMYEKNVRVLVHRSPATKGGCQIDLHREVLKILRRAKAASSSPGLRGREAGPSMTACRKSGAKLVRC